jgi:signal peptidase I
MSKFFKIFQKNSKLGGLGGGITYGTKTHVAKKHGEAWVNIKIVIEALLIALVFRSFVFDNFHVPSGSMKPTLLIGDKIIVSKYSYGYSRYSFPFGIVPFKGRIFNSSPQRGDIVVFKLPSNKRINYVKRLIGLPGDVIQMKDGLLYINDIAVHLNKVKDFTDVVSKENFSVEQYIETLPNGVEHLVLDSYKGFFADDTEKFTVPQEHYFFMGDNRDNSQDSRFEEVGFVHKGLLLGKVKKIFISSENSLLNPFKYHKIRFSRIFSNPYDIKKENIELKSGN